jgi:membrane protease YdiL (CAAX protease family)
MNVFFKDSSPFFQFIFTLFLILILFLTTLLVGTLLAFAIFNLQLNEIETYFDVNVLENMPIIKYFQALQTLGLFILPSLAAAFIFGESLSNYLKLDKKPGKTSMLYVFITILGALPVINVLIQFNETLKLPETWHSLEQWMRTSEEQAKKITEAFLTTQTISGLLTNLLIIAVLPAIGEELIFRGIFQKQFTLITGNKHWGIFISAFIFSAMHLQFYGFLPRLLLGIYFGYLLIWSKSLWLPILAHFFNNGMAVLFYFFYANSSTDFNPDTYGTQNAVISILSAFLIVFMIYFTKKISAATQL